VINARFTTLTVLVLAAAATRLLPHPPNATPIAAMALFGAAHFTDRRAALLVPLLAMALSDLALGYGIHPTLPFVYASFLAIAGLGFLLRRRVTAFTVIGASLISSVLFFVVTNLGVWAMSSFYPPTWEGLVACYTAAIPFFRNTLAGDLLYCGVLFGGFALAARQVPALRAQPSV
jgi:hypothetical protein